MSFFTIFKIKFWWNRIEKDDIKQTVKKVAIRCSNCGKETMTDGDLLETDYQKIITTFALNIMLHHVGMIWIIENHEYLKYDTNIQNSNGMTCGTWYNTYICKKIHRKYLRHLL